MQKNPPNAVFFNAKSGFIADLPAGRQVDDCGLQIDVAVSNSD
jgi:hypothetical protein